MGALGKHIDVAIAGRHTSAGTGGRHVNAENLCEWIIGGTVERCVTIRSVCGLEMVGMCRQNQAITTATFSPSGRSFCIPS